VIGFITLVAPVTGVATLGFSIAMEGPNKLEALPLPVVLSSIAIENPKVATPVTGATNVMYPNYWCMYCFVNAHPTWIIHFFSDWFYNISSSETIHTPIIWIHVNNLKSVCV
jgi:hypothetical protein